MASYTLLLVLVPILGCVLAKERDVTLTSVPEQAVNGQHVTLKCAVNPALNTTNTMWMRRNTPVMVTSMMGYTTIIDRNQTEIGYIMGRYFVNMHGFHQHHLTLRVDKQRDEGTSWRCMAYGTSETSDLITLHPIEPESPPACGVTCIFVVTTAVVVAILLVDLAIFTKCLKRI